MTTQVLDPPDTTVEQPPPSDLLAVLHPRTRLAARARLTITVPDGWDCEVDPNSYLRLTDPTGRRWLVSPPWSSTGRWSATCGPLGKVLGNMAVANAQAGVDFVVSQSGLVAANVLVAEHDRGRS